MILTCPECASSYFVDDSKVGRQGRVVRCASCGARWTARNEEADDLFDAPPASVLAAEPAMASVDPVASNTAESEDEPPVSALPGEELPKVFRARADAERRLKEAKATGIVWGGMAAAMAIVLVAAGALRLDVARLWPKTAGAYAMVGLDVNTVGLVVDKDSLKAQPSLEDGHAVLIITGVIRNVTDHAVTTPPLRVSLLNAKNKRVAGKIAVAADPVIPPSQTRHFSITLVDPPSTAKDLEIGFALEHGAGKGAKTALHAPAKPVAQDPELRGAVEAHAPEAHAVETAAEPVEGAGHEAPGHETGALTPAPAEHH